MAFFYAVKVGKTPGIYETWAECEAQVKGFKGAKYKKFPTYEEALNFIQEENNYKRPERHDLSNINDNEMVAYVDGSFDIKSRSYSYGVVIVTSEGKETFNGREDDYDLAQMRNVAGEIKGAMIAMEIALERGKDTLYIYYDYAGIENWVKGDWKTNKEGTIKYKEYYDGIKDKLNVVFIKVKAHTGIELNEEADRLAKEAIMT